MNDARAHEGRPGAAASAALVAKPGIAAGVVLAGLAGMVLAGRGMPGLSEASVCLFAILLAASGSAALNVVLEARVDARMERTRLRAHALERLGARRVTVLSLFVIACSLALCAAFVNLTAAALMLAAAVSYTLLYTLHQKRRSPYGTVPGGVPGALPVLIGYASVSPGVGADGLILFAFMLLWQPPHFLSLALKHKDDYAAAGLPVMPVVLGREFTLAFIFIYATALFPVTLSLWVLGYCSGVFAAASFVAWCAFLYACYHGAVRTNRPGIAFGASIAYVMAMLGGVVIDVGLAGG